VTHSSIRPDPTCEKEKFKIYMMFHETRAFRFRVTKNLKFYLKLRTACWRIKMIHFPLLAFPWQLLIFSPFIVSNHVCSGWKVLIQSSGRFVLQDGAGFAFPTSGSFSGSIEWVQAVPNYVSRVVLCRWFESAGLANGLFKIAVGGFCFMVDSSCCNRTISA